MSAGDDADKEFEKVAKKFKKREETAKSKPDHRPKKAAGNYRGRAGGYHAGGYNLGAQAYWAQRLAMPPPPPLPSSAAQNLVMDLACNGVIEFVSRKPTCVNPLGLVSKVIDGAITYRLVLDVSRWVNLFTAPSTVKLVHLKKR